MIGISGWSGSGKTSIIVKLIIVFKKKYNKEVCVIKRAHEDFTIDHKGKDSFKFSQAGAKRVIVSSRVKWVMLNHDIDKELKLEELIDLAGKHDIVIIEGWKEGKFKKIEIFRSELKKNPLYTEDKNFIAIATNDKDFKPMRKITLLDLNNEEEIADFIINNY